MRTYNKKVACTPYPEIGVRTRVVAGVAQIAQKHELVRLTVLCDAADDEFRKGDYVWVRADSCAHQFAKDQYEVEGFEYEVDVEADGVKAKKPAKKFVLVPYDVVVMAQPETYPGSAELLPEDEDDEEFFERVKQEVALGRIDLTKPVAQ